MPQEILGKIRLLVHFNFLFDNPCLFQVVCFHFKLTAIYMYCLSVYFSPICGTFSLLYIQSICFQKGHQYSYIRLSSQFNFPCVKLVPLHSRKYLYQFVVVKLFIQFNILHGNCNMFQTVRKCVKLT